MNRPTTYTDLIAGITVTMQTISQTRMESQWYVSTLCMYVQCWTGHTLFALAVTAVNFSVSYSRPSAILKLH